MMLVKKKLVITNTFHLKSRVISSNLFCHANTITSKKFITTVRVKNIEHARSSSVNHHYRFLNTSINHDLISKPILSKDRTIPNITNKNHKFYSSLDASSSYTPSAPGDAYINNGNTSPPSLNLNNRIMFESVRRSNNTDDNLLESKDSTELSLSKQELMHMSWDEVTSKYPRKVASKFKNHAPYVSITVYNVDSSVNWKKLSTHFSKVGRVASVKFYRLGNMAHVEMYTPSMALKAVSELHGTHLAGKTLKLKLIHDEESLQMNHLHDGRVLEISNLPPDYNWQELQEMFFDYGIVRHTQVVKRDSQVIGFVIFNDKDSVERAVSKMNDQLVNGRRIHLTIAQDYPKNGLMIKSIPCHVLPNQFAEEIKSHGHNLRGLSCIEDASHPEFRIGFAMFMTEPEAADFMKNFTESKRYGFEPKIFVNQVPFIGIPKRD